MSQADQIRAYVIKQIADPVRAAGKLRFSVRAGDVHHATGLSNAMPNVCSAIGSKKFETAAGVRLVHRVGPHAGPNAKFEFEFTEPPTRTSAPPANAGGADNQHLRGLGRGARAEATPVDFTDAVCLISCVKTKQPKAAPARELYISSLFLKARDLVEAHGSPWYVLSALYGLVPPHEVIQPYDLTLNKQGIAYRKDWARKVLQDLMPRLNGHTRLIFFAGQRYREFLVSPLRQAGFEVCVPMIGLRQGEQLAWLSRSR
ncbi:DUF6884 domain-containing protein [Emcibacter sp. SYSU 3D8]|uniref:DUF6884 domain-containing protein n=1 Tax=Emcibacter sp. SYSU 3D8 TaxID=3133969 RepID=UPI0031FE756B